MSELPHGAGWDETDDPVGESRPGWMDRAACRTQPRDVFFGKNRQKEALTFCAVCSVSPECLDYALTHQLHGVWGGTTMTERRLMGPGA